MSQYYDFMDPLLLEKVLHALNRMREKVSDVLSSLEETPYENFYSEFRKLPGIAVEFRKNPENNFTLLWEYSKISRNLFFRYFSQAFIDLFNKKKNELTVFDCYTVLFNLNSTLGLLCKEIEYIYEDIL